MATLINPNTLRASIKFSEQRLSKKECLRLINALQEKSSINSVLSIDLSGIQSLTADSLSVLVNCKKYADEKGVRLVLKGISPVLEAFFELTRLKGFFFTATALAA